MEIISFLYRFCKYLTLFLVVLLPLQLLFACILAPVLPIMRFLLIKGYAETVKLPYLLRWADNADIYVNRDTSTYLKVYGSGIWKTYCWLAWRNPLNYFGYTVLGINTGETFKQTIKTGLGSGLVGDRAGQFPGLFYTEIVIDSKTYFEYYYISKYSFFGIPKCLRIRIGHKIGIAGANQACQWCFVISPFHSYAGN